MLAACIEFIVGGLSYLVCVWGRIVILHGILPLKRYVEIGTLRFHTSKHKSYENRQICYFVIVI